MNPENKPDPSFSPDAGPATLTADWHEHEHASDQVQLEAQKLVDLVGSCSTELNRSNKTS